MLDIGAHNEFHIIKLDFEKPRYFLVDSGSAINIMSDKLARKLNRKNFEITTRQIITANNTLLPIWGTADFHFRINDIKGNNIKLIENFNIVGEENFPSTFSGVLGKKFLKRNSCNIIYRPDQNYFQLKGEIIPLKNCQKVENFYMHYLCKKEREKIVLLPILKIETSRQIAVS